MEEVVLITVPSEEVARTIAKALVEERLAACVNIVPGLTSIYRWQGEVVEDKELLLLVKTTTHAFPKLKERVKALHQEGARFLVIGGYALAFFGRPRFTKDLDLWVDAEEAPRVLAAIRRFFGGDDLGLTVEDLASPGVVQLGYAPNRIDLVILETPPFDEAFVRALKHEVEGVQVYVVHPEDFKALKRAFGRPVDLRDLEELE